MCGVCGAANDAVLKSGDAAGDAGGLKTITDLADNMAWLLKKLG
jgi:hypothetical protein